MQQLSLVVIIRQNFYLTLGTAAWNVIAEAADDPDTWNLARIMTTPGLAADVCGVRVILNVFLSYAVYCCSFEAGPGGAGAWAGAGAGEDDAGGLDWEIERDARRSAPLFCGGGDAAAESPARGDDAGGGDVVVVFPKRPRMSSMVDCCDLGAGDDAPALEDEPEVLKISSMRPCEPWPAPLLVGDTTSSIPSRSPPVLDPTGLFSLTKT